MQRFAFITGTSRGIGAALARVLVERGWSVIGTARGPAPEGLDPGAYSHLAMDIGDLGALGRALDTILTQPHMGSWDQVALVNNAGAVEPVDSIDRLALADLDRALRVNLTAPMWTAGRFLRLLPDSIGLRIAHLGSGAATSAYSGWSTYCSAKAGLSMAARCVAEDVQSMPHLQGRDVRVLDYAPGVVATEMQAALRASESSSFPARERFVELHETGKLVAPEGPATELADLLEDPALPAYSATRFGTPR